MIAMYRNENQVLADMLVLPHVDDDPTSPSYCDACEHTGDDDRRARAATTAVADVGPGGWSEDGRNQPPDE